MKSRERKRKYVKDLEAKAKILESECRRLEHLYQCVKAENISLHRHLQKDSVSVVYQAGQESAVLFKGNETVTYCYYSCKITAIIVNQDR